MGNASWGSVRPGIIIELEQRCLKQMIVGKRKVAPTAFDEIDNGLEEDAHKLAVEREAARERLAKQREARELFSSISAQLSATIHSTLDHQLASPEQLLAQSGLNETQFLLLDILYKPDVALERLRLLITDLPWLSRDLLNVVNSSAFRHRRQNSAEIKVTESKLVLNFIGLANLQTLIPYFCLRHWLPQGQAHLSWTTRKVWRYTQQSGIAAKALAELNGLNPALAFSCTLLNQLGLIQVLKASAKVYEQVWSNWLKEANQSQDRALYDAVLATEFPAEYVYQQVVTHGGGLNWQLPRLLNFETSPLTQTLAELDNSLSYKDLSAYAALVARASCYAKVSLLDEMEAISFKEKRLMYDYHGLTEQELFHLQKQNYRKLQLI
ncbi:HDOD domain-containing protein [Shewanella sp. AS1]|uniref:HDOD domain-containing protein n=1 Tax=Shewanella sp. AS1 TaxID=2907626 RepID=UPI001F439045|nr:HDOD domain-containing protein [Shewanella sp. AS1]MCE9677627.1 HDOD domain-containing protein [Shewanella sp. AS1]